LAAASAALARTSARERVLAALLGLIVLMSAALVALDWSQTQEDRAAAAVVALQAREQARARAARGGLDAAGRQQLSAVDAMALKAPDLWIARVRIEEQLAAAVAEAGVREPEITVAAAEAEPGALPTVRAEVSGAWSKPAFAGLLTRLASGPYAVMVEHVQAELGDNPRFILSLEWPVESAPAGARR
jgi:hypothetical protein